jgi:membrane protease YdiL (CAAX protease family)
VRVRGLALQWPLLSAVVVSAAAIGILWSGVRLADRVLPTAAFLDSIQRVPALLFAFGLLALGRWWRGAGFRRPRERTLRHGWPVLLLVVYLLPLIAWHGPHRWLPLILEVGVVACWEEIIFRGIVLLILLRRSTTLALFGSAALFGAFHVFNALGSETILDTAWQIAWPFALGLIFGVVRIRSGSIWPTMALHFLVNLVDALAPTPLTLSGITRLGLPVEVLLFFLLFVSRGLFPLPRGRRLMPVAGAVLTVAIVGLSLTGLFVLGGPRPGWAGPGWDASMRVRTERDGGGWLYGYELRFRRSQAEIVSFTLKIAGNPPVRDLHAAAGDRTWEGSRDGSALRWAGGVAPKTAYRFRSSLPPDGTARFRVVYRDRYGWERSWEGVLDDAPGG